MTNQNIETIKAEIYETIRSKIIDGNYPRGKKITEYQIANELNINKIHVHDVLIQLQQDGFVEYKPMKGFFSLGICKEDIIEYAKIRECLESMLYTEFIINGSNEDIEEMLIIAKRKLAILQAGLNKEAEKETINQYEKLYSSVDFPHTINILDKYNSFIRTMIRSAYDLPKDSFKSLDNSKRLIRALETRNPELMKEWIHTRYLNTVSRIKSSNEYYSRNKNEGK